jgi:hypothetical protein
MENTIIIATKKERNIRIEISDGYKCAEISGGQAPNIIIWANKTQLSSGEYTSYFLADLDVAKHIGKNLFFRDDLLKILVNYGWELLI